MCCAESRDVLEFSLPSGKSDILVIFSLIFLILPLKPIKGRFAVCDFSVVIWHITTSMMEIEHVLPPAPIPSSPVSCSGSQRRSQDLGPVCQWKGCCKCPLQNTLLGRCLSHSTHCTFTNLVFMSEDKDLLPYWTFWKWWTVYCI